MDQFNQSDCQQQALVLVSNGAAIIAELLRLSNHIPDVFLFQKTTLQEQKKGKVVGVEQFMAANGKTVDVAEARLRYSEQKKYLSVLFDLEYIKDCDQIDNMINDSVELTELDESFKESYFEIIKRFYDMFEQIYLFYVSMTQYLTDVQEGKYIEFTIEALIQIKEGKRLIAEIMHHYSAMLLLLDRLIPAVARERIVTCYLRYMGSSASQHHVKVCKLVKDTGYTVNRHTNEENIPEMYPAKFFSRFKLELGLVKKFINTMKDDDIYEMTEVYGQDPNHRSQALSKQASILFCILPFAPMILDTEEAKMREICDKHFPDNWVIPIYGGQLVDLLEYWKSWPAANKALKNNIVPGRVEQLATNCLQDLRSNSKRLNRYIIEGQLQEKEALANVNELLGCLRDANTTIRWVMLHEHTSNKVMRETISGIVKESPMVRLLLKLSKFEHLLNELVTQIVKKKSKMWTKDKEEIVKDLTEVSEFFAGNRDWGGIHEDQFLSEWCQQIVAAVEEFEYKNTTKVGRKIQKMVEALEDLQLQHNIVEENAMIQDKISRTINNLMHMIRIMGIKKEFLGHMRIISDFSFAWIAMHRYLPILREVISDDAGTVMMLRTVFLKMSSIMDTPLMHISNAGSTDFESVANYYSTQLLDYVQRVLQVIPVKIFQELDYISKLMATQIKEFEVKVSKEFLKENILEKARFDLAKKTHEITLLTEGMLKLDKTLMGVIELDPKKVLVVGLRNELCRKLAEILHQQFIFTNQVQTSAANNDAQIERNKKGVKVQGGKAAFGEFGHKFAALKSEFVGLKRSIEYIQDFLNVQGEKIWREEFQRIVELAVEKEATKLVNKKYTANIDANETQFVPEFEPVDENDLTFMGRLLTATLSQMNQSVYLDQMSHWYTRDGEQTFGLRFINFLHDNLGTQFLQGFDKLIQYKIVSELRSFYRDYSINIGGGSLPPELQAKFRQAEDQNLINKIIAMDNEIQGNYESLSGDYLTKITAIIRLIKPRLISTFLPRIQTVGKLQLLRRLITKQIHYAAKVESAQFTNVLVTLNDSILLNLPEIKENAIAAYADDDGGDIFDITSNNLNQTAVPNQMFNAPVQLSRHEKEQMAQKELNNMLQQLTVCSENVGFLNPMNKVYAVTMPLESMSSFFSIFTLAMFQYLRYDTSLCSIMRKNQYENSQMDSIDGPHFITGLLTIFKQFHGENYRVYIQKLTHFFKNIVFATEKARPQANHLPDEGFMTLAFLEELIKFEGASRDIISQNIGTFIFDAYRKETTTNR